MYSFEKYSLENGLKVILHHDEATPMVCVNVLYDVGARDEEETRTGFAHLFEHLMFGSSVNVPIFDEPIEMAGGKNNAFTSNDMTNYYEVVPAENIETALWLESDRMISLAFSPESLEVQRKVVCEEFKEHYINQPYGDVSHIIRELSYKVHPYKWPTIGKNLAHIEEASLEDVKAFFKKHYAPNNAILVVAGGFNPATIKAQIDQWFGAIPSQEIITRNLPSEPRQIEKRQLSVEREVPANALYLSFHGSNRRSTDYYVMDLLTDLLSSGKSSRLYLNLVKDKQLFSSIECYHYGSMDNGLIQVEGKLQPGVSFEIAEAAVMEELQKLGTTLIEPREIEKLLNKLESQLEMTHLDLGERAFSFAYYELVFNDPNAINTDAEQYKRIDAERLRAYAADVFRADNCNCVYYQSKNQVG
jgi:predicted Zn-dependent peptidase